jgi:putative membrane protein
MKNVLTTTLVATGMVISLGFVAVAEQPEHQSSTVQNRPNTLQQKQNLLNSSDTLFMTRAAQAKMIGLNLSQLALDRTSNDDVRQYAERMTDQHTQAYSQLIQLAGQKGVILPKELDARNQQIENQLQQLSGASFDQAYMRAMTNNHTRSAAFFQKQVAQGQDQEVVAYASRFLLAIEQYQAIANSTMRDYLARYSLGT